MAKKTLNKQLIEQGVGKLARRAARKGARGGFRSRNQRRKSLYASMADKGSVSSEGVKTPGVRSGKKTRKRSVGPTDAKQYRIDQAQKRQAVYDALSFEQKFERLEQKERSGLNCTRERARLERQSLRTKNPSKKKKHEDEKET